VSEESWSYDALEDAYVLVIDGLDAETTLSEGNLGLQSQLDDFSRQLFPLLQRLQEDLVRIKAGKAPRIPVARYEQKLTAIFGKVAELLGNEWIDGYREARDKFSNDSESEGPTASVGSEEPEVTKSWPDGQTKQTADNQTVEPPSKAVEIPHDDLPQARKDRVVAKGERKEAQENVKAAAETLTEVRRLADEKRTSEAEKAGRTIGTIASSVALGSALTMWRATEISHSHSWWLFTSFCAALIAGLLPGIYHLHASAVLGSASGKNDAEFQDEHLSEAVKSTLDLRQRLLAAAGALLLVAAIILGLIARSVFTGEAVVEAATNITG
jgi:hypothetical protein